MKLELVLILLAAFLPAGAWTEPKPHCIAPPLSEGRVKDLVAEARATRKDLHLPTPFMPPAMSSVHRDGCYYVYIENALPPVVDRGRIFVLNQFGAIVDVMDGFSPALVHRCPDRVFSESELASIVRKERAARPDLPKPFPQSRVAVTRSRCLYRYTEWALPFTGESHTFEVDPFGGLMHVYRHGPVRYRTKPIPKSDTTSLKCSPDL